MENQKDMPTWSLKTLTLFVKPLPAMENSFLNEKFELTSRREERNPNDLSIAEDGATEGHPVTPTLPENVPSWTSNLDLRTLYPKVK